jgi:alpha-ketoglutarate-dependent 2,4-dichlorophenoxyacetate dioxygenase
MAITIQGLTPTFGAAITDVLLRDVSEEDFADIRAAFEEYSLLLFPAQELDDEALIAFSRRFGDIGKTYAHIGNNFKSSHISRITNLDKDGALLKKGDPVLEFRMGQRNWHSDSSFKRVPATASLLHARILPAEGGETDFATMRAAYDTLPEARKQALDGLIAIHHYAYSRRNMEITLAEKEEDEKYPPVPQALVRTNPANGKKALYLSGHASHIDGMEEAEGRALIEELIAYCTQPQFTFRHKWGEGDLIMYDNRCLMHRARPYAITEHPRVLHRTTVLGDGPTV